MWEKEKMLAPSIFSFSRTGFFSVTVNFHYFLLIIRPSKMGCIMGSPVVSGWAGRVPILCPEHISKTASYAYEISWVDRSHQGGVQCTGIITLACLILSYCPLFIFILEFCPEHIPKTILAMVMKFCSWIDLIKQECSAHELLLLFAYFLSYCPLFTFILEFCLVHISKTILAMVMKFCEWIHLIKGECSAQEL